MAPGAEQRVRIDDLRRLGGAIAFGKRDQLGAEAREACLDMAAIAMRPASRHPER
ncbi:hypothetical protein GCM10009095_13420 [Sphingomonas molluscorum]|nr:hypothetical protein GCM10017606_05690 [Microbacterium terregens]